MIILISRARYLLTKPSGDSVHIYRLTAQNTALCINTVRSFDSRPLPLNFTFQLYTFQFSLKNLTVVNVDL